MDEREDKSQTTSNTKKIHKVEETRRAATRDGSESLRLTFSKQLESFNSSARKVKKKNPTTFHHKSQTVRLKPIPPKKWDKQYFVTMMQVD